MVRLQSHTREILIELPWLHDHLGIVNSGLLWTRISVFVSFFRVQ